MTPLVLCEAVTNIVLTFALVRSMGAEGAAWATLVTMSVSNLLVLPFVLRDAIERPVRLVLVEGLTPMLLAGTAALVILAVVRTNLAESDRLLPSVLLTAALTAAAAVASAGSSGRAVMLSSVRDRKVRP